MATNEEKLDQSRRRLSTLLDMSYAHIVAARALLDHKAAACPGSAVANAHALLTTAKQEIERWILASADLVGVNVLEAELTAPANRLVAASSPAASSPTAV